MILSRVVIISKLQEDIVLDGVCHLFVFPFIRLDYLWLAFLLETLATSCIVYIYFIFFNNLVQKCDVREMIVSFSNMSCF